MKQQIYVVIYGRGGHQEQMKRLLSLQPFPEGPKIIAITESMFPIVEGISSNHGFKEFRSKSGGFFANLSLPIKAIQLLLFSLYLLMRYNIKGVLTTGPGIAIIPSIALRFFGKRLVVFESWSKFTEPSKTGKLLYSKAGLFIVQHRSMLKVYPRAVYWGKL